METQRKCKQYLGDFAALREKNTSHKEKETQRKTRMLPKKRLSLESKINTPKKFFILFFM